MPHGGLAEVQVRVIRSTKSYLIWQQPTTQSRFTRFTHAPLPRLTILEAPDPNCRSLITEIAAAMGNGRLTINNLPNEILILIFLLSCPSYVTIPPSYTSAPWVFTLVNTRWRTLVLGIASLWDHILFDFKEREQLILRPPLQFAEFASQTIALAHRILERVDKDRLLSISNNEESSYGNLVSFVPTFIDFITPISSRLRSLDFLCGIEDLQSLLSLSPSSFPVLEEITFIFGVTGHISSPYVRTAFQDAHRLSKVTFKARYAFVDPTMFDFPWTKLSSLQFTGTIIRSFGPLSSFLHTCQNLTSLRLDRHDQLLPDGLSMIILPSLITFDYRISEESWGLLSLLHLPTLQNLTLRLFIYAWDLGASTALATFANCSFRHLQGICIIFTPRQSSPTSVQHILPSVVNVLASVAAPIVDCRFLCLDIPKTVNTKIGDGIFPGLRKLTMNTDDQTTVADCLKTIEALHNNARDRGQRHLELATVIIQEEMQKENIRKVKELLEKGAELRVMPVAANWNDSPQRDEWVEGQFCTTYEFESAQATDPEPCPKGWRDTTIAICAFYSKKNAQRSLVIPKKVRPVTDASI
ncbi:hypothetical protein BDN72DRAFT_881234 [Pluteus cervinus]|uniref:Uncharacterized protein n=1 Tax=Pluteus cervinus TaxID=181527 RepID=A0ACD3AHC0_9AGAR|nr:hypothetical protein BDN72DRAFT_881234 [Pluteus cervinus]